MNVLFENQQRKYPAESLQVIAERVAAAALAGSAAIFRWTKKALEPGIGIHLVGTTRMRAVNRDARGVDRVTDVLSFPMMEMTEGRMAGYPGPEDVDRSLPGRSVVWLGDILVCPVRAEAQAKAYGHSFQREFAFLVAHGMLHLLGYDHEDPSGESRMFALQESILQQLGYYRCRLEAEGESHDAI
ncbi:MAG: rRNA maturation RNase YbeY [Clostridia bacterium]|nr:rRNA maturation RNase YbeY [Clostridia bacterium]